MELRASDDDRPLENPPARPVHRPPRPITPLAGDLGKLDHLTHAATDLPRARRAEQRRAGRTGTDGAAMRVALRQPGGAGSTRGVRLVCFGDIHMALRAIERMAPVLREADVAILTGDITNFGDPPDAFQVVEAVRAHCQTVWAVTGNLDMAWVIDAFRDAGISLHGESRRLGSLGVFGCGGSNITPMDTPTEFEEHELADVLSRGHASVADAPRRLMICHTPPFDSRLDRLVNGTPVGSPAVRRFIETHEPDVAVVGHIHEGRGVDRVGRTLVLNPGALRDGGYVVVDDDGKTLHAALGNWRDPRP